MSLYCLNLRIGSDALAGREYSIPFPASFTHVLSHSIHLRNPHGMQSARVQWRNIPFSSRPAWNPVCNTCHSLSPSFLYTRTITGKNGHLNSSILRISILPTKGGWFHLWGPSMSGDTMLWEVHHSFSFTCPSLSILEHPTTSHFHITTLSYYRVIMKT